MNNWGKRKRIRAKAISVVLIVLIMCTLGACVSATSRPASVLDRVERAYNERDINALVECYEPNVQKAAKGVIGFAGGLLGVDLHSLMPLLPFASKVLDSAGLLDDVDLGKCEIKEIAISENGDTATITYSVHIKFEDGSDKYFEDTGDLVKIDGEWYIKALPW